MDEFLKQAGGFINQVGFPVFVAVFVLYRLEPALGKLTEAIISLREMISACHPDQKK